ncbi:MAG TPA: TrkA family potassium uptake protein [Candidatus Hydrogenedentes bacterium]|nr:TrkA family potassium uptake protein [Candidatus Hydrogenedentota bacterium]HRK34163.1 TrkA family potassium uptake protein [Candidatus Hydrogenedentota bacterium]
MKRTFAVVGLGTLGTELVKALSEGGATVIAIDNDAHAVDQLKDSASQAVCMDVTNEQAFEDTGAFDVDVAILAMRRNFEVAVLATYMFRKHGVREIVAHVDSELEAQAIRAVGATSVVFPEKDLARWLAQRLLYPGLTPHVSLGGDVSILEIPCPASFVGKTLADLHLRKKHEVAVIAIKRPADEKHANGNGSTEVVPSPESPLTAGSVLVVLGKSKTLEAFIAHLSR